MGAADRRGPLRGPRFVVVFVDSFGAVVAI
jgi:hypothetical protein